MDTITEQFKKGYKTTEFWLALAGSVIMVVNATTGLNLDTASIVGILGTVVTYIVGRSYLKGQRVAAVAYAGDPAFDEVTPSTAPPVG